MKVRTTWFFQEYSTIQQLMSFLVIQQPIQVKEIINEISSSPTVWKCALCKGHNLVDIATSTSF